MPYNSYFPAGYQPAQIYYPQPYQQPVQQMQNVQPVQQQPQPVQQQNQPVSSGIIWVNEKDVDNYLVAPNTAVELWDKEKQVIYIKSADAMGMTSVKILDYSVRNASQNAVSSQQNAPSVAFATKDEVNALSEKIEALRGDFEGFSRRTERRTRKDAEE